MGALMKRVKGILLILLSLFLYTGCDAVTGALQTFGDAKSSNALLKELSVSEGVWDYAFNPYDNEYTITVVNEIENITVKPKTDHVFATVKVNDSEVKSGSNSDTIPLSVGKNTITVTVTAWDGTTNTYTLTVTRSLSTVTSLETLQVVEPVGTTISDAGNNNYNAVVGSDVSTIRFAVETTHSSASLEMQLASNGVVGPGEDIYITNGLNLFIIKVTAQDGITKEYYTVGITRLSGDTSDCRINSLGIQKTTLDPAFDPDDHNGTSPFTFTFNAEISSGKLSAGEVTTDLVLTTNSGVATVRITDPAGTASWSADYPGGQVNHQLNQTDFPPRDDPYPIIVRVTSGSGANTTEYTINLTVRAGNNDATLSSDDGILLTWGAHNSRTVVYPGTFASHSTTNYQFNPNLTEYIAVMAGTETVTVKAKANDPSAASITINGDTGTPDAQGIFSKDITLTAGYVSDVTIKVMAEDNVNEKTYTVKIKLLNAYEYYWGIYGPLNNLSFARWEDWKDSQGLTIDAHLSGLSGGDLYWKTTTGPTTYMEWTNYSDGNAGGGTWNIRTDYNYYHPSDPNYNGFTLGEGKTYGELKSLTNRDGYVYGGFTIDTRWGDRIMEAMVHYWIDDMKKVDYEECSGASWAEVLYMGQLYKMKYKASNAPYPFTDPAFDWTMPWIPSGYPFDGYPKAPPAGWSWHLQYDNPPSESDPPGSW